jgi:hypothetical protein
MIMKAIRRLAVVASVALVATGCDMNIVNLNAPDRVRALSQPGDVEALVGGTFTRMWNAMTRAEMAALFPATAADQTGTTPFFGAVESVSEPRVRYNNAPDITILNGPWGARLLWALMLEIVSSANDGLATIEERQMRILGLDGTDNTARAKAFAKFMQGWAWGNMAMMYDTPLLITEHDVIQSDPISQGREALTPWPEVLEQALTSLEEAKQIAAANTFSYPGRDPLWFGTPDPVTNQDLIRMANTLAARLMVLSARTPEERRNVDWQRVLAYTGDGLTQDFEVQLGITDPSRNAPIYLFYVYQTGLTSARWDMRLAGQADTSGAYQHWIASPLEERVPFLIETPDRRITGETSSCERPTATVCSAHGSYTRYFPPVWPTDRGRYYHSFYQWARPWNRGANNQAQQTFPMLTADENNLLRAEALLRTGNLQGAADLINITRTRPQTLRTTGVTYPGLPPVTVNGVPQSADCVPRTDSGACGDLMVALRYERMIELTTLDAIRSFVESRGFGLMPDGSYLQVPVPGGELVIYGMPIYTYGGVGGDYSAVYKPSTMDDI